MFSKSITERSAPHVGIGFLRKISSERRRMFNIHSGSCFIHEISFTISGFRPRLALKTYSSGTKKPYFSL